MNKVKNFLLNKGVYLIAMGCVAVVCLSGLYIANIADKNKGNLETNDASSITEDAQGVIALPTMKTSSPENTLSQGVVSATITPSVTQSAGTAANSPEGSTAASTGANAGASPGTSSEPSGNNTGIKMDKPVNGNILVDYAMDKLVYNKTLDEWRTHSGVDLAAPIGTEVKAAYDGKVIDVKKEPRLGFLIILEHTNDVKTIYANLKDETDLKIGDTVKKGDVIGWVGRTAPFEYDEEPHLHFEILVKDVCANVWDFISK